MTRAILTAILASALFLVPPAHGSGAVSAHEDATSTSCRMSDVGWKVPCRLDAAVTLTVVPDCPDDLCAFTLETLSTGRVDFPGPYEIATRVFVGGGLHFHACLGLNKEQNDFFAEQFPHVFPCVQSCRENGIGTDARCEGTFTGVLHVPAGKCNTVGTTSDFGYYNSGTWVWMDFYVCRAKDGSVTAHRAPYND